MVDGVEVLPSADVLAMLDADPQGWALARAVRAGGEIVDFRLEYVNDAGARFLGRARGELVGRTYRELWPETVNDDTIPFYRRVVTDRRPATRTVYYDRPSVSGHFELWIGPSGDGFAARFVDLRSVTLGPQTAGGSRLYDVLDAAFDGFTLLRAERDADGAIVDFICEYVNAPGAALTGRAVEETIGRRWTELTSADDRLLQRWREVAQSRRPWREQVRYDDIGQVWEIGAAPAGGDAVAVSFRNVSTFAEQQQHLEQAVAAARRAAGRNAALLAVTSALVAASTTADVYAAIGAVLRPSAGGQGLAVLLRRDDELVLQYHAGYEPQVVARLRAVPLRHRYPATTVAGTGRARYLSTLEEFVAAQDGDPAPIPSGGRQAWAFLPLAAAGDVLGTLVIGYGTPHEFDDDERANLEAFAGVCAQAMQRALLFEAKLSIAGELQRALLPADLPQVPGLRHAARYLPWTHGADVGGDWYDVIPLGDDVVAVVIGDVVGHNATAAAVMGQVRNALRAYAAERHSPSVVMQRVNRLLLDLQPDAVATCCYLELHLAEGTATAVLAGHPPPVMRTGATADTLVLRAGPPLGVSADIDFTETTFLVPGGANLLLYTDGLVEDRRYHLDDGLADLRKAVQAAPSTDPADMLEYVLTAGVGPQPRTDDVAVVCLAVAAAGVPPASPTTQRRFRGDAVSASAARRFAADVLRAWGEHRLADDTLLLLDEVITNAIQHTVGAVVVRLELRPDRLRVTVADRSERLPSPRTAGDDSENGRGLLIVAAVAAAWGTETMPAGGKEVWFEVARRA
ncbi:SpoIIE family protein phosphatase [Dactylosporangium vinaceum]|uniref:SpoIIE family protein phosphatase n=1 Tax=Dactylosporangium vinaceum TaxID=53362 RepID=A0ABV5M5R3_9ACTN|nr:SpoIIE family protein phosphatase [Dactylosporangium vinaceum]UAC01284.1 SpoIIE family protein phosphatase [Dactylosporangium vinaceum]